MPRPPACRNACPARPAPRRSPFNERIVEVVKRRRHVEAGIRPAGFVDGDGPIIGSNYFDLGMLMDYWSEMRLNHHTEATSMLYAAREAVRIVLAEGLDALFRAPQARERRADGRPHRDGAEAVRRPAPQDAERHRRLHSRRRQRRRACAR